MGELVLVLGCGAFAMALAWYSDRRKIRKFIDSFRKLQEFLVTTPRIRVATAADARLFDGIAEAGPIEAKDGLRYLGDFVVQVGDASGPCRVFVDSNGTSLFYLERSTRTVESYTTELVLETKTPNRPQWIEPPFRLQQTVRTGIPVSRMVAAHREFSAGATRDPLRRFETLADAIHAWQEISARTMTWRAAQDPDVLLQHDLRMLVGPGYEAVWKRFGSQLRGQIPRAQARSRAT